MQPVFLLLLTTCSLQAVRAALPQTLDLRNEPEVVVSATSECGVSADGTAVSTGYRTCAGSGPDCIRTCGTGENEVLHSAELAVDQNRNTSWQSPPLSFYKENTNGTLDQQDFTIDLGRVRSKMHFVAS